MLVISIKVIRSLFQQPQHLGSVSIPQKTFFNLPKNYFRMGGTRSRKCNHCMHLFSRNFSEFYIKLWTLHSTQIILLDRFADWTGLFKLHRWFSKCTFSHLNSSDLAKCTNFSISSDKICGMYGLLSGIRMTASYLIAAWKVSSRMDNIVFLVPLINLVISLNSLKVKMKEYFSLLFCLDQVFPK